MKISGLQKLTLLDFPGSTACIIFTQGCNFNCPYCHNSELLDIKKAAELNTEEVMDFLKTRKPLLDGVVITGGEPTIQSDLKDFIKEIRALGYKVKLDTNGSTPKVLEDLLKEKLLDYVAMDIKTVFTQYESITKINGSVDNVKKSIDILKNSNIPHEFRMTIIKNRHSIKDIIAVCEYVGPNDKLYLQNFEDSDSVRDKTLESFTKSELTIIQELLQVVFPNVTVRGI